MGKISKSKDLMLKELMSADAAFMITINQAEPGEDGQLSMPEVRAFSHHLPAEHFSTVMRGTSNYLGNRIDYILLDYLRLLQQEKERRDADIPTHQAAGDAGSSAGDGPADSKSE